MGAAGLGRGIGRMMRHRAGLVSAAGHAALLPAGAGRHDGGREDKKRQKDMDALAQKRFHSF